MGLGPFEPKGHFDSPLLFVVLGHVSTMYTRGPQRTGQLVITTFAGRRREDAAAKKEAGSDVQPLVEGAS